jgi:hypothetical protein
MSGFYAAEVYAEFFAAAQRQANFVCNPARTFAL